MSPRVFTLVPTLALAAFVAAGHPAPAHANACVGDCNGDRSVTIDDIVRGVPIALGSDPTNTCPGLDVDGNAAVTVDELLVAVSRALDGCPAGPATPAAVVARYAEVLYGIYGDAAQGARRVRDALDAFRADPTTESFAAARRAWLEARPSYLVTEAARFYDGPIDNPDDGPEGRINAWPLDEAYIDYVADVPLSGIVNDPTNFPEITREVVAGANEAAGETAISTGWHAIEFLLWGQDFAVDGPGARPHTDYLTGPSGTAPNPERRRQYLDVVADLLVDDIEQVRAAWAPAVAGNYRAGFVAVDPKEALRRILTGLGTLSGGELTGERLAVPFETKDQEDEHSCFADNTHVDHRLDQLGIRNLWLGRHGAQSGPALVDLVAAVNPALALSTSAQMETVLTAFAAVPVPFDQAIRGADSTPGRQAILATINALNTQTALLADCAAALGISISTTLP